MTIKQIAKKYGLEYSFVYNALGYAGLLKRHFKNVQYDEMEAIEACTRYIMYKLGCLYSKEHDLLKTLKQISKTMEYENCEAYKIKKRGNGICRGNDNDIGEYDKKCDICPAYIRYKETVN